MPTAGSSITNSALQKLSQYASQCVQNGGHPLVLTERREHAEEIHSQLTKMGISTVVLKGAMKSVRTQER